jgi:hypothetical protein
MDSRRSHPPLFTDTILPDWQVTPPLERKYGGSAKIRSIGASAIFGKSSSASP